MSDSCRSRHRNVSSHEEQLKARDARSEILQSSSAAQLSQSRRLLFVFRLIICRRLVLCGSPRHARVRPVGTVTLVAGSPSCTMNGCMSVGCCGPYPSSVQAVCTASDPYLQWSRHSLLHSLYTICKPNLPAYLPFARLAIFHHTVSVVPCQDGCLLGGPTGNFLHQSKSVPSGKEARKVHCMPAHQVHIAKTTYASNLKAFLAFPFLLPLS
ncbi:hypothetical protein BXZ70DRAFT_638337 [Cristinia sonorae]|uniref:Uncharacterized protein n=1 Tax=Cristinia sonorae TaxID=1940300 RepID=A0A8K0XK98_9AGAR|nr:hypothetical protein BXZ70DRAFT_638337 [Cristinia sonorae]